MSDVDKYLSQTYTERSFGGAVGLLAVREDPARHIGRTDKIGIYNMFTEIIDNSIDELIEVQILLGEKNNELTPKYITVDIDNETGECVISDQGRGIPLAPAKNHPDLPTFCAVFERDNMGSKGNKSGIEEKGYSSNTIGTHGAGAYVVTACSKYMHVFTTRFSEETDRLETYYIEYNEGVPVENEDWIMNRVYKYPDPIQDYSGTIVRFKPDTNIMRLYNPDTQQMESTFFDIPMVEKRIQDTIETLGQELPIIVQLTVDGEHKRDFDSRELSITKNLVEGVDYVTGYVEPDENLKKEMDKVGVSDFSLEIIIKKLPNPDSHYKSGGYVNRIKVDYSTHINELNNQIMINLRNRANTDSDLRGFFERNNVRGIEIVSLLSVEFANWDAQVKNKYTDYQLSSFMSRALHSQKLFQEEQINSMLNYAFSNSKPFLLVSKDAKEKEKEIARKREEELLRLHMQRKAKDLVRGSISWLNLEDRSLYYSGDIDNTTLIILEGSSANTSLMEIRKRLSQFAVFDRLTGKTDNLRYSKTEFPDIPLNEMQEQGMSIKPIHKIDALFKANWKRIGIMLDPDSDGLHMRALLRYFTHVRHPELIDSGRLYEVSPDFCGFTSTHDVVYEFRGEEVNLGKSGTIRTELEYDIVRTLYPGTVHFQLYKGVGSMSARDLENVLLREDLYWDQVPPLSRKERYMLEEFFTTSSRLKVSYTMSRYGQDLHQKDKIKSIVYKDTMPNPVSVLDDYKVSDVPDFNRITRVTVEDYLERGSALSEEEQLINAIKFAESNILKYDS